METTGPAKSLGIFGDDVGTERVESGDLHKVAVLANEVYQARAHFAGGGFGEGEGEDGRGFGVCLFEDVGDAGGENLGFASAGTSENQHGAFDGVDSLALSIV